MFTFELWISGMFFKKLLICGIHVIYRICQGKFIYLDVYKRQVQTSPSMSKNVMMGFLLGIALCGGIICVLTVMDDSIKSEDDMEKYLGIPVLASVPDRKDYINQKKRRK